MKKTLFALAFAVLLMAGCTGKAAKEAAAKAQEAEIEQTEAVISQIDSTITEIQEAGIKLDTLLNEL